MKADNLPIAKVFSSGGDIHYVLPHFQREYTWDKENWQTLFDDALAVYEEMEPTQDGDGGYGDVEHFLGSIVVIHDGMRAGTVGAFKLVDGQQRLTTISLLLKALAKSIEGEQPGLARKIDRLLVNADEDGELFYKILPTVKYGDRAAYCSILKGETVPPNDSKIPIAYRFFETELAAKLVDSLNPEKLLQVLINAFQVVFVNLDQRESPYRIFESLNAKGKPLTQADLVRNYVAMKLPAAWQERIFTDSWSRVEELLQETRYVGRLPELTAFLRHYLAMKTGILCDEKHVYARFRDRMEKEFFEVDCFEKELQTIARVAVYYDKLIRPHKFADVKIALAVERLNELEILTAYPFLLRIVEAFDANELSNEDFCAALETLENYMVRRYIAGEPASYLNRMFPTLWSEVKVGSLVPSLKEALARRNYPSDEKLFRAVEGRRLYDKSEQNRHRTALVLETINRRLSVGTGGYTVLDASPTIEHVMPQTLSDSWKAELGLMWEQIHRDHVHTLGNLTLVTAEWNSELSNADFGVKRAKLAANALRLNNSYFNQNFPRWGREEIRERSKLLCQTLITVWPSFLPSDAGTALDLRETYEREALEFHFAAVEHIAARLGSGFRRLSQAKYATGDGQKRFVGLCSKVYEHAGDTRKYWYGIKPSQREFLEGVEDSWFAFECESPDKIVLIPFAKFQPLFRNLRETEGKHWHVDLVEQNGQVELPLPLNGERVDVTRYRLGIGSGVRPGATPN
jgi:uncharacterized protein with ParB-like and HNH nuclease domain